MIKSIKNYYLCIADGFRQDFYQVNTPKFSSFSRPRQRGAVFLLPVLSGFLAMLNQIVGQKRIQLKFPNTLAKPVLAMT